MMPVFMAMMLLGSLLLKPLHELTVHHCEKSFSHDKTEVTAKITDCPICDLQVCLFTSELKTYDFSYFKTESHQSVYGLTEGFYVKVFDKKRGRAPPIWI